jgi:hypothetical protein
VRAALQDSEPVWRALAAWWGADCAARRGPLDDAELGAAAAAELNIALPAPLGPDDAIPGGWGTPAMALHPRNAGADRLAGRGSPGARALFDARHALEVVRTSLFVEGWGRDAAGLVNVSWASAAAPKACATYKEAVQR